MVFISLLLYRRIAVLYEENYDIDLINKLLVVNKLEVVLAIQVIFKHNESYCRLLRV
jgi:hypothetical protein